MPALAGSGDEAGLAGSTAWPAGGSGTVPVVVGSVGSEVEFVAGEEEGTGGGKGTPAGRAASTLMA